LQAGLDAQIRSKQKYDNLNDVTINRKDIPFVSCADLGRFGRAGNQFFQVAALISLANKYNCDIAGNWFCSYTKKDMSKYFKNKLFGRPLDASEIQSYYNEPNFSFNELPYKENMNLHGYFQSEKYFKDCKDLIRYYFEPSSEISNKLQEKYSEYLNVNTCSIHIRRLDYLTSRIHNVCDLDYYNRSIDKINSIVKIDHFLVFSDDIQWCKENFSEDYIYVNNDEDMEDLFLISMCKHNIIANSTFSWWGSWLNNNPDKQIIVPQKWFSSGSNINYNDIYTKNMIRI
jgi:hypothetical protein